MPRQVTCKHEFTPAGECVPVDGCDDRLAWWSLGDAGKATTFDLRSLSGQERLQIHPCTKRALRASEHANHQVGIAVEAIHRGSDPFCDGSVDRIADVGTIDRDDKRLSNLFGGDLNGAHATNVWGPLPVVNIIVDNGALDL